METCFLHSSLKHSPLKSTKGAHYISPACKGWDKKRHKTQKRQRREIKSILVFKQIKTNTIKKVPQGTFFVLFFWQQSKLPTSHCPLYAILAVQFFSIVTDFTLSFHLILGSLISILLCSFNSERFFISTLLSVAIILTVSPS